MNNLTDELVQELVTVNLSANDSQQNTPQNNEFKEPFQENSFQGREPYIEIKDDDDSDDTPGGSRLETDTLIFGDFRAGVAEHEFELRHEIEQNLQQSLYGFELQRIQNTRQRPVVSPTRQHMKIQDFFELAPSMWKSGIHVISIGCAANLTMKGVTKLNHCDNHQMFPFIQILKTIYEQIPVRLILIDPLMEDLPYCITGGKEINISGDKIKTTCIWNDNLTTEWIRSPVYSNVFVNEEYDMQIFVFKNKVDYNSPPTNLPDVFNIKKSLLEYQQQIIDDKHKSILFVHNFGESIISLAHEMDYVLNKHINLVMYDITMRQSGHCFPNLSDFKCMPAVKINIKNNPILFEIMNPFCIKTTMDYNEQNNLILLSEIQINCMKAQLHVLVLERINNWRQIYLIFRSLYLLITHVRINNIDELAIKNRLLGFKQNAFNQNEHMKEAYINIEIFKDTRDLSYLNNALKLVQFHLLISLKIIIDHSELTVIQNNIKLEEYTEQIKNVSEKTIYTLDTFLIKELQSLFEAPS
jgi:hypothetical protein